MKTETGFNIKDVLTPIIGKRETYNFKERCQSYSGGASSYIDRQFGEQSYQYQFSGKQLEIRFKRLVDFCYCTDECECFSIKLDNEFKDWEEKMEIAYETITLNEKQINSIFTPNLFD